VGACWLILYFRFSYAEMSERFVSSDYREKYQEVVTEGAD
jgi:hypothetical protein